MLLTSLFLLGTCLLFLGESHSAENKTVQAAIESITPVDLKKHVDALADDLLEGREAGTRGGQAARGYLINRLRKHSLKAAGTDDDYLQPFGDGFRNILALLEGSDPELKDEIIVIGAHYDHVGYGKETNSHGPIGYIHNGADDNASGTAALLEMIEAFGKLDQPPRRSILFAFWDAEEKGLLGSNHWVQHPTLPIRKVGLMLNIDMVGRLTDDKVKVHGTRTAQGLRRLVSQHNRSSDLHLDFVWEIKENSDHFPFYEHGIPFLMLHTGLHEDYHRPSDDADKVNSEGMQRVTQAMFSIAHQLAKNDKPLKFREAVRGETEWTRRRATVGLAPLPGRLGVSWDRTFQGEGVLLNSILEGSAAEQAGLRRGDRIMKLAGKSLNNGKDLRAAVLTAANPTVALVKREGKRNAEEVTIQLTGHPVRLGLSWWNDGASPGVVVLNRVVPDSPADRAGLKLKDRIYQVNDQRFADGAEFKRVVNERPSPLKLLIERKGHLQTIMLESPPRL